MPSAHPLLLISAGLWRIPLSSPPPPPASNPLLLTVLSSTTRRNERNKSQPYFPDVQAAGWCAERVLLLPVVERAAAWCEGRSWARRTPEINASLTLCSFSLGSSAALHYVPPLTECLPDWRNRRRVHAACIRGPICPRLRGKGED